MRAPLQILALPYKRIDEVRHYCVLHRSDCDQWQFISGGGEDDETPLEAARREIFEESGISLKASDLIPLTSMCYIPANVYTACATQHWPTDLYVVPEYSFGFECKEEISLSSEHDALVWLPYAEARNRLTWDSNKTALYELDRRLDAEARAIARSYLGKAVTMQIDRPLGSRHPKHQNLIYEVNYGYLPDVLGGDGEELDVYLLGVDQPVSEFEATVIGVVHRKNDIEDKLVAAPHGIHFTKEEIYEAIKFQEQFFETEIITE